MDSTSSRDSNLAASLESRLQDWTKARDEQEKRMRDCYADEMRIPRDDDTKGTGQARARKTKGIFVGVTRNKIRTARAKLNDSLFGTGAMPFDTKPNKKELRQFSDAVESIVTEQLIRGEFKKGLKRGVHRLATYGTAFAFGPFVREEVLQETAVDTSMGFPQIVEQRFAFDLPYFEFANPLDVIPDPDVDDPQQGAGVFWISMESPHTVRAWANQQGYENIDEALKCLETKPNDHGSDQAKQLRGNVDFWRDGGRVKVARYFGKVKASALRDDAQLLNMLEGQQPEGYGSTEEEIEAIVVVAGGVVIRKTPSEYKKRPVYRCVYEESPDEMWGVGIAENNAPHQALTNAAFRLFNEAKGMALLGTKAIDRSKFLPTEDFKKYPGKNYAFKPGLTPEEKKAAIIEFVETDVSSGWQELIALSEQFSDDDTGITKYTQGNDASHLNKTASGISMIMGASALPLKDVLQNVDEMWIEPIIEALIEWNIRFLEPETVEKLLGPEVAQQWQAVKQFGKTSFMTWHATGAATFMQKEVLMNKLQGFLSLVGSNPAFAGMVDLRELLAQVWDAMQMGRESPIRDEDAPQIPPELQAQIEQGMEQLQMLAQENEALKQQLTEAQNKQDIDAYKALTDRIKALESMLTPEAIAVLMAQTLAAAETNVAPGPDPQPQMIEQEPGLAPGFLLPDDDLSE